MKRKATSATEIENQQQHPARRTKRAHCCNEKQLATSDVKSWLERVEAASSAAEGQSQHNVRMENLNMSVFSGHSLPPTQIRTRSSSPSKRIEVADNTHRGQRLILAHAGVDVALPAVEKKCQDIWHRYEAHASGRRTALEAAANKWHTSKLGEQ